jgi:hypothetical protein
LIKFSAYHCSISEFHQAWIWAKRALTRNRKWSKHVDLVFPEIDLEVVVSSSFPVASHVTLPAAQIPRVASSSSIQYNSMHDDSRQENDTLDFSDEPLSSTDRVWEPQQSVVIRHRYLILKHSIQARQYAAQALFHLSLTQRALDIPLRAALEGGIIMALIKLTSLEEKPIDSLIFLAKGYEKPTSASAETVSRSLLDYDILPQAGNPTFANALATRRTLIELTYMYSQLLHRQLGDHDPTQQKVHLQLSVELSSFSIALSQATDEMVNIDSRVKFNRICVQQLKQRGGTFKASPTKKPSSNLLSQMGVTPKGNRGRSYTNLVETPTTIKEVSPKSSAVSASPVVWVPDHEARCCLLCATSFGLFTRRHHCRACGTIACGTCCKIRVFPDKSEHRVCNNCVESSSRKLSLNLDG